MRLLCFLMDTAGRSYYKNNGIVDVSSVPVPLEFTPEGWEEISILAERNLKLFGMDRSFTNPWGFVEDGGLFLRYFKYSKSIEEQVYFVIVEEKIEVDLNAGTYGIYYDL